MNWKKEKRPKGLHLDILDKYFITYVYMTSIIQ